MSSSGWSYIISLMAFGSGVELKRYEKVSASAIRKVMTDAIIVMIRNIVSVNFNGLILNYDMDLLEVVETFNNFL